MNECIPEVLRFAGLSLREEDLLREGKLVLVAYILKPMAYYDYLATAAHCAAVSSTGANANVCTADDFTKTVDAMVHCIYSEEEKMKIAFPVMLFDRDFWDERALLRSVLALTSGNNQGMDDVEVGKICGFTFNAQVFMAIFVGAQHIVDCSICGWPG